MRILLLLGLLLTPFSTGVDSGYPVISFGLPFLLLALLVATSYPVANALTLPRAIAPALISAGAVVAVMTAFTFVAPYLDRSLARLVPNLICYFLVFRLTAIYAGDREFVLEHALKALAFSGAVMALYFVVNMAVAIALHGADAVMLERYTGGLAALPWGASNNVSAALVFPHIACHMLHSRYRYRWSGPMLCLILLAVGLTMSRAGFVVHGALFLTGCLLSRNYRYLIAGLLSAVLLLWIYVHVAQDNLDLLMSTRFSSDRDISNGRLQSYGSKIDYLLHHAMAPIGYYGSLFVFNGLTAHNFLLTVLVEQGLPGFIALLLFLATAAHALLRTRRLSNQDRACRRILAAGGCFAFANLLVEDAYFTQPFIVYFWTFFFIVMTFSAGLRSSPKRTPVPQTGKFAHG